MLNKFYQKQQLIMTMLGYYDGVCDGAWGPKCVAAKAKWELDDSFEPAVPSNGLPFVGRGKLPKGMNYSYQGLDILWDKWDQARAEEILASEKGQMLTAEHVHNHVMQAENVEPVHDEQQPQITARGQHQSEAVKVDTLKPYDANADTNREQTAEPSDESEKQAQESEEEVDEDADSLQEGKEDSTSEDKSQQQNDWLKNRNKGRK
ncbi:putative lysozyme [Erwinia phage vB_EamM_Yoloswag]|uniref:Putative lysozyme n=1 Tax=Erwinia phage vB_EamM_Yoloswag TaxID=1958956 RepID=A0A1S6L3C0_9CAUD|nr:putative lysozyme [Erwinia phage vB_EamM_Yoloswag]AQT28649.1 putative lysozyme [Erwinia phage vB_EamM_Yoloswag]